jgi:hypothetical protein
MADKEVNGAKLVEKPAKIPIVFQLGEVAIDGAVVQPMSFQQFSDYIGEAQGMRAPKTFEARLRRLRLTKQVQYFVNGTAVPVGTDDVTKLRIVDARALVSKLDEGEGPPGKIIRDGDGIDKSIVYELGTPIPVGPGKPPIKELEFSAQTYGDIEDIMSAPDSIQQTAMLIATIAKPVGHSLQALPSWALGQIKIADGVTISRLVTPHFLGSPDE